MNSLELLSGSQDKLLELKCIICFCYRPGVLTAY